MLVLLGVGVGDGVGVCTVGVAAMDSLVLAGVLGVGVCCAFGFSESIFG